MKQSSTSAQMPVQVEWDFREVTPEDFEHVAVYEYARSCPWVVAAWQAWLKRTIPTPTVVQLDEPTLVWNSETQTRISNLLEKYPAGIPPYSERNAVQTKIVESFPPLLAMIGIEPMLLAIPEFPTPYFMLRPEQKARLLKTPLASPLAPPAAPFRDAYAPFSIEPYHRVIVDWGAEPSAIRKAFKIWLDAKLESIKRNPIEKPRSKTGRAAGPQYHVLSWLAAYRIREAGISFLEAQDILAKARGRRDKVVNQAIICELPIYPNHSNWSENAEFARELIQHLFVPQGTGRFFRWRDAPLPLYLPRS